MSKIVAYLPVTARMKLIRTSSRMRFVTGVAEFSQAAQTVACLQNTKSKLALRLLRDHVRSLSALRQVDWDELRVFVKPQLSDTLYGMLKALCIRYRLHSDTFPKTDSALLASLETLQQNIEDVRRMRDRILAQKGCHPGHREWA